MTRLTFGVFFDDQRVMRLAALGKGMTTPPPAREEQLLRWRVLRGAPANSAFFTFLRSRVQSDPARGYFIGGSEQFKGGIFPFIRRTS